MSAIEILTAIAAGTVAGIGSVALGWFVASLRERLRNR